jgi:hypothetical protein
MPADCSGVFHAKVRDLHTEGMAAQALMMWSGSRVRRLLFFFVVIVLERLSLMKHNRTFIFAII